MRLLRTAFREPGRAVRWRPPPIPSFIFGRHGQEKLVADLFDLSGRHVLVTGASSGLGRHFAGTLAAAGAKVSLAARREGALAQTVERISGQGGEAHSVVMDVTDAASIERALDAAEERFGPVRVLVNNAGVTVTRAALDLDEREWDQVVDLTTYQLLRHSRAAGRAAA